MPGIKNVSKGECFSNPNGACRNSPKGSIIKAPPPNKAETELKNRSVMQENRIIVFISVLYDPGLIYYKNKILFRHGKANKKSKIKTKTAKLINFPNSRLRLDSLNNKHNNPGKRHQAIEIKVKPQIGFRILAYSISKNKKQSRNDTDCSIKPISKNVLKHKCA